jgi:tetratricopeptide (TPR) repeat protein
VRDETWQADPERVRTASTRPDLGAELAGWTAGEAVPSRESGGRPSATGPPGTGAACQHLVDLLEPAHFVGRERDLAHLDGVRAAAPGTAGRTIVLSGPAGGGKTTLAVEWLRGHVDAFPDGQLYVDLCGHAPGREVEPQEALDGLLRVLGIRPVPSAPAERSRLWRSVTSTRRLVVMLDNVGHPRQIGPLLPGPGDSVAVVTSRGRLTGLAADGVVFHEIGPLEPAAAMRLLVRGMGFSGRRRAEREPAATRQVVSLSAGLPLNVCLASARMASSPFQSMSTLAGTLTREGTEPTEDSSAPYATWSLLDASYRTLSQDEALAYCCLGLSPVQEFDETVVAAACDIPLSDAARRLDVLVGMHLVQGAGGGRYRFHDVVLPHARRRAELECSPIARRKAVRRVLDLYLEVATTAETLLCPGRRILRRDYEGRHVTAPFADSTGAERWLDHGLSHLMALLRAADGGGWHAMVWQLVDAMWPAFLRLRPQDLWPDAHHLGLAAARRAGHRDGVSRMLTSGGVGLRNAGQLEESAAWFGTALAMAKEDRDLWAEAQALDGIGVARLLGGRLTDARGHLDRALTLRERIGYKRGAALTMINLGNAAREEGRHAEAADLFQHAYDALMDEGDLYDAARAQAFLGRAHADLGRTAEAERQLLLAQHRFHGLEAAPWEARVWEMLGEIAEWHDDTAAARRHYQCSYGLYERMSPDDADRLAWRLSRLSGKGSGSGRGDGSGGQPGGSRPRSP